MQTQIENIKVHKINLVVSLTAVLSVFIWLNLCIIVYSQVDGVRVYNSGNFCKF